MSNSIPPKTNPIFWRETLMLKRGAQFPRLFKIIYWVCGVIFLLAVCAIFSVGSSFSMSNWRNDIGYPIVVLVLFAQKVVLFFFIPPLTAGAIANERKHETLDLLLVTTISIDKIIDGKLLATLPYVFRLVFWLAVPLIFSLFARDVNLLHIFFSQLVVLVSAIFITVHTLYISTYFTNTSAVLGTVYGSLLIYGIAVLLLVGYITDGFSDSHFLVGLSPIMALITSFFVDEFDFPPPISHGLFYAVITFLLYAQTRNRLKIIANR